MSHIRFPRFLLWSGDAISIKYRRAVFAAEFVAATFQLLCEPLGQGHQLNESATHKEIVVRHLRVLFCQFFILLRIFFCVSYMRR